MDKTIEGLPANLNLRWLNEEKKTGPCVHCEQRGLQLNTRESVSSPQLLRTKGLPKGTSLKSFYMPIDKLPHKYFGNGIEWYTGKQGHGAHGFRGLQADMLFVPITLVAQQKMRHECTALG